MSPKRQWIAFYTLLIKEIVRFFRFWPDTLLPPIMNIALYLIIFGGFLGVRIGPLLGISYTDYIVPGLILMTVITSAFANVVGSFYISKFTRDIEELLVSPMPIWLIIAGYIGGGIARGFVSGILVIIVALFFWEPQFYSFATIFIYLLLTSLVFSLAGLFNGIFAKKFDDISLFATFILTPLTYLGGVFFSIDNLPGSWKLIAQFNPILYMISGFRYGFYGVTDVDLSFGISILILLAVTLALLNGYLLSRGVGIKE